MALGSVAAWLALSLALLAAGLPLAAALFPRLADRGASVALPLVLTVVFYGSYYVGRLSLPLSLTVSLVALAVAVLLLTRRDLDLRPRRSVEIGVVFTAAFLFLVAVRAVDPAIVAGGGEKFLDFGLVKSFLRAETVPAEDFWFAGEPVLYYFGGHLLVSQQIRLLGTAPGVAYNLALAGVYASYVTAAYGLAGNVAARDDVFERRAALLGAFFVGLASNLFTPLRILLRPLPDGLAESLARALDVWAGRFGREGALITDRTPFSMWDATGIVDGTIHEMPIFAFVNGDLHAHMMAPPFTLLLATALFAYVRTPAAERRRRLALLFGVVPAVGGALAVVNTWSFFATGGLTALAVLFDGDAPATVLPARARGLLQPETSPRAAVARLGLAGGAGLATGVLAVLLSLPFWLGQVGGRSVGLFPDRSSLPALLVVHGTFLLPVLAYFGYLAWARFDLSRGQVVGLLGGVVAWVALTAVLDLAVLGVTVPLLAAGYLLGARVTREYREPLPADGDAARLPGFELVLLLGALGLLVLVEFVYLEEHAGVGRFNTVFKIYAQVWALFAVGAAVALGRLLQVAVDLAPTPRWPTLLRGFVALLVVATSLYGAIGLGFHFDSTLRGDADLELDGTAWVDRYHPGEAPAIRWLDAREGTPTIVTRPGEAYRWPGGVSALTGVPTIIGWQHHERGFGRDPSAVAQRAADVEAIYTGPADRQRRLLAEYDVQYVYVGPTERETYGGGITVSSLDGIEPAAEFEDVTIYRVGGEIRE